MNTTEERLKFAVDFAQRNLDSLRPGDWLNLREDLLAFLGFTPTEGGYRQRTRLDFRPGNPLPPFIFIPVGEPASLPETDVKTLQRDVTVMLRTATDDQSTLMQLTVTDSKEIPTWPLPARHGILRLERRNIPVYCGNVHDGFLLVLIDLLKQEFALRLQRCPECERSFLRVRRQKYCSRQCVNRANMRAWLKTPQGKEKSRAQAKRHYEGKLRKKLGPKVRIEHKSPRGGRKEK